MVDASLDARGHPHDHARAKLCLECTDFLELLVLLTQLEQWQCDENQQDKNKNKWIHTSQCATSPALNQQHPPGVSVL